MNNIKNNETGLTMIELLISIAVIGIIIVVFIPLFLMSAKTNIRSEVALDSTYLGKDAMELIYNLSQNILYKDLDSKLTDEDYIYDESTNTHKHEYDGQKYVTAEFKEENNLIRVVVKVYRDDKLEAQYESLYSWFGRGILGEEQ